MSFTSKFTERFDIDPSQSMMLDLSTTPHSDSLASVYSTPSLTLSDPVLTDQSTTATSRPIAIPKKNNIKNRSMSTSPQQEHCPSPKDHAGSKFKHFLSTLSRKRDRSSVSSSSLSRAISTKY
ncbi:uncharacterized protein ATC70_004874 [Mucor velutinosus]|uniref:Uncharacterized protein n=1 Tax=Mucor velutinosus TaxID=708070 RepID=A0AAN7D4Z9_9FUNG|nr:hypothetical protein ATC70_004874 [Mucor velutinosus]